MLRIDVLNLNAPAIRQPLVPGPSTLLETPPTRQATFDHGTISKITRNTETTQPSTLREASSRPRAPFNRGTISSINRSNLTMRPTSTRPIRTRANSSPLHRVVSNSEASYRTGFSGSSGLSGSVGGGTRTERESESARREDKRAEPGPRRAPQGQHADQGGQEDPGGRTERSNLTTRLPSTRPIQTRTSSSPLHRVVLNRVSNHRPGVSGSSRPSGWISGGIGTERASGSARQKDRRAEPEPRRAFQEGHHADQGVREDQGGRAERSNQITRTNSSPLHGAALNREISWRPGISGSSRPSGWVIGGISTEWKSGSARREDRRAEPESGRVLREGNHADQRGREDQGGRIGHSNLRTRTNSSPLHRAALNRETRWRPGISGSSGPSGRCSRGRSTEREGERRELDGRNANQGSGSARREDRHAEPGLRRAPQEDQHAYQQVREDQVGRAGGGDDRAETGSGHTVRNIQPKFMTYDGAVDICSEFDLMLQVLSPGEEASPGPYIFRPYIYRRYNCPNPLRKYLQSSITINY